MTTCTIGPSATDGTQCGKPAFHTFTGTDGKTYAECAEHYVGAHAKTEGHKIGETVTVHRYGKAYTAVITKVTRTGTAYATFRYGNGAERTVRI